MTRKAWTGDLLVFSRIILGAVFIFSGFVKGVDPMGSAFKFSDYFLAFGMESLEPASLPLAFILSAAEFLIGISLFFNLKMRLGAWGILIFMTFFTPLTLILALTNPVTDCGCFGDAIVMTNWQTFIKNIILLPFVLIVFFMRKRQTVHFPDGYAWLGIILFASGFLAMEWYVYQHLPFMDFRPYSVGTNIPEKMSIPEGAEQDVYRTVLHYEKNGEVREFNEENFPWQDTTWTFVDSEHVLVNKGYALIGLERYDEAIAVYESALQLEPNNSMVLNNLGNLLSELGQPERALELYNRALEMEPGKSTTLFNKGNALIRLGRYEEAIEVFDHALETDPDNIVILNNKACTLRDLGRLEEALVVYGRALDIDPEDPVVLDSVEEILRKLGKLE